jgi:hypothetical protein
MNSKVLRAPRESSQKSACPKRHHTIESKRLNIKNISIPTETRGNKSQIWKGYRHHVKTIPPNTHNPSSPSDRHLLSCGHSHTAHLRVWLVVDQNPFDNLWKQFQPRERHRRKPFPGSAGSRKSAFARLPPCLRCQRRRRTCERGFRRRCEALV